LTSESEIHGILKRSEQLTPELSGTLKEGKEIKME
jgi:hypothetical protein